MKISETDQKLVDHCIGKLMEHFDSARIFVTRHNPEGDSTESYTAGGGNFYAQLGQVKEWKSGQDELVRDNARKDASEE